MEIGDHWKTIRGIFDEAFKSNMHFAVATVTEDGSPHVAPIGSLILRDDPGGFYFEEYPVGLPRNLKANPRVCIMAVNSDKMFWGQALMKGKFFSPPGVRLYGRAGHLRNPTPEETAQWLEKIAPLKGTKGYELLWSRFSWVRDVVFDAFEPVETGEMTRELWK